MKKQICLWSFLAATVFATGLRIYELLALIEHDNGFIIASKHTSAVVVTAVIVLVIAACAVFVSASAKNGNSGKGFYLSTSLSALALGVTMAGQPAQSFSGVPAFLKFLCIALSVLCAAFFIAFALRCAVHFPLPSALSALPAAFFVVKAACITIKTAYHTVISDTLFEVSSYCFIMLFFLEFARLTNGTKTKTSLKKFAALGTAAAALSLVFSVPKILVFFLSDSAAHGFTSNELMLLFAGVYIACEVFSRLLFTQQENGRISVRYVGKH